MTISTNIHFLREAQRSCRTIINDKLEFTCSEIEYDDAGEVAGITMRTFNPNPMIDVWEYWTDSHGRPAKRFLRRVKRKA